VTAGAWPPPPDGWDVLVNTTPVGTTPALDASPIVLDGRLDGRLVYDLVYNPRETALLRQARRLGAATLDGLPMLAAQAALQFTWWTGSAAPASAMQQAAAAALPGPPLPVTQRS
jgi:shikimate 5-dehydrogenase